MMVMIGGRDTRSSGLSSTVSITCSTSASETRTALWPNSSITSSAVSASMVWFIVTIMPIFISDLTTSAARSAIRLASSCTTIVSGSWTSRTCFSARDRHAHRLLARALLLALHRGERALTPAFAGQRLVQGQLAGAAAVVALALAASVAVAAAVVALAIGLALAGHGLGRPPPRCAGGSAAAGAAAAAVGLVLGAPRRGGRGFSASALARASSSAFCFSASSRSRSSRSLASISSRRRWRSSSRAFSSAARCGGLSGLAGLGGLHAPSAGGPSRHR